MGAGVSVEGGVGLGKRGRKGSRGMMFQAKVTA